MTFVLVLKLAVVCCRYSSIQHENLTLKQQVDNLQRSIAEQGGDKSVEYNKIIASMQADSEKVSLIICVTGGKNQVLSRT